MADHLTVVTATPDRESAARIASSAVAQKLAAGAQVHGPVSSFFWHLGESGEGQEWVLTLKTSAECYDALEAHIVAEHPWDKPEVNAVALVRESADYGRWVDDNTVRPG